MALSEPLECLIIFSSCFLTVRSFVGLTRNIRQINAGAIKVQHIKSKPFQIAIEHEILFLIVLKYYRGAEFANHKGNPDYLTGFTYIKLGFVNALSDRTQDDKKGVTKNMTEIVLTDLLLLRNGDKAAKDE
jgi:hypothetical protein